jgi:hypothetical protein
MAAVVIEAAEAAKGTWQLGIPVSSGRGVTPPPRRLDAHGFAVMRSDLDSSKRIRRDPSAKGTGWMRAKRGFEGGRSGTGYTCGSGGGGGFSGGGGGGGGGDGNENDALSSAFPFGRR